MLKDIDTKAVVLTGTCVPKSNSNSDYTWPEITCKNAIKSTLVCRLAKCGFRIPGVSLAIQFNITNDRILKAFTICYSRRAHSPLYSYFQARPRRTKLLYNMKDLPLKSIYQDKGFDFSQETMERVYNIGIQRLTINKLLDLPSLSAQYIDGEHGLYLTPTFLVPDNFFYYKAFREATFRYVNSAPMWKQIKFGNWAMIERSIKNYINLYSASIRIWMGIDGTLQLPKSEYINNTNVTTYVNLFLYPPDRQIPVPTFFWAVVLHSYFRRGVALIVVNNPFANSDIDYIKCQDISEGTMWLDSETKRMKHLGLSYACTLDDFAVNFKSAPVMENEGFLRYKKNFGIRKKFKY